ncbi:NUDIX domain-containing protein [Vibrio parahaemolyticus]|uniref:NUDIX hydrolase n=1 Tax=Vibrio parahaemolyticus TaxID=670 RepID=UPI00186A5F4E|nr:NUDIX domain-containing protein [Vibrio parahaemolyticus]EGQ7975962.1 NUDIX domain-containing protein [Vibrio parahaemolyticus]MBE3696289.1 NUDIX domain-containing protein [Vibrio parahaemolyticus]MBM4919325.1 NUDIX domain-containing protein [Vibrio parahaemolyticus]MCI9692252.1 NUDIX domain-containing protein [Vibrio parahaemolyticus]MCR9806953.1 NUDIX domain-containing protein [Vibrio parahaemolyticus]
MEERIRNREVKVCPVVLRKSGNNRELLLFEHPLAEVQLVKGTLEQSDISIESAALRELEEESGLSSVSRTHYLGSWESGFQNHLWHFVLCEIEQQLPNNWSFFTQDDGGHKFNFFWYKVGKHPEFKCHKVFSDAIKRIEIMCIQQTI